jgi:hypothetical protein
MAFSGQVRPSLPRRRPCPGRGPLLSAGSTFPDSYRCFAEEGAECSGRGSAPAADWSCRAVFRFDAVLAEQGAKALDLIAELSHLLGNARQVRVRGSSPPRTPLKRRPSGAVPSWTMCSRRSLVSSGCVGTIRQLGVCQAGSAAAVSAPSRLGLNAQPLEQLKCRVKHQLELGNMSCQTPTRYGCHP